MSNSDTEQFKKDWISSLLSTSGIMLTICLMVLTILYTAANTVIQDWQRLLIAGSISGASIFLMLCARQALDALGTIILASKHRAENKLETAIVAENLTAEVAKRAQSYFTQGLWLLLISIAFSFLFLNWSIFVQIFGNLSRLR